LVQLVSEFVAPGPIGRKTLTYSPYALTDFRQLRFGLAGIDGCFGGLRGDREKQTGGEYDKSCTGPAASADGRSADFRPRGRISVFGSHQGRKIVIRVLRPRAPSRSVQTNSGSIHPKRPDRPRALLDPTLQYTLPSDFRDQAHDHANATAAV